MKFTTHEQIAEKAELDPGTAKRFISYMRGRWESEEYLHCVTGYAMEWALRFKNGSEYEASDADGRAILERKV